MYISNKDCINGITGVIYEMHPYHKPENINDIVDAIEKYYTDNVPKKEKKYSFKLLDFKSYNEFKDILDKLLKSIDAFRKYNISKALKDKGVIDPEDPRNSGIVFSDRCTEIEEYYDFIDLDACIRNIALQIWNTKEYGEDCFLCKYAKKYGSMEPGNQICNTCICNNNITFKREPHPMSIKPYNEWTEEEKKTYRLN